MAIIEKIRDFYKKKFSFLRYISTIKLKTFNFNPVIFISFIVFFSVLFFTVSNIINKKNKDARSNLAEVAESNEFSNLINYFASKINHPYGEVSYIIKKNDTIEKILKNNSITSNDIKKISTKLREKKLSSIYSGRKLSLI